MAELSAAAETAADACCGPEQRAACCEPSQKGDCCAPESSTCGCSAAKTRDDVADEHGRVVFGGSRYEQEDAGDARRVLAASLGCGVPRAVADVR
jgi:arsenite methyltransferase